MEVEVIEEATSPSPEWAVCLAARNDYYAGNIMDDDLTDVMQSINPHPEDVEWAFSEYAGVEMDVTSDEVEEIDDYKIMKQAQKRNLIRKLLKKEHYGPFEHPQIMFHVENMSRVTMAQITRHRHMSFDIQSMRYVDFEDANIAVPKSLTDPEHFSRETGLVEVTPEEQQEFEARFHEVVNEALDLYNEMVEAGFPKEDARYVLPLGTQVNVTFSGNLRTMLHVANMRGKADAQWEIRELTEKVCQELDDWAPHTMEYFEENGPFKLGM